MIFVAKFESIDEISSAKDSEVMSEGKIDFIGVIKSIC